MPGPRWPSHCSSAPRAATRPARAAGSSLPPRTSRTKPGKRLIPWEVTPSQVLSAKTRARAAASASSNPEADRARSNSPSIRS